MTVRERLWPCCPLVCVSPVPLALHSAADTRRWNPCTTFSQAEPLRERVDSLCRSSGIRTYQLTQEIIMTCSQQCWDVFIKRFWHGGAPYKYMKNRRVQIIGMTVVIHTFYIQIWCRVTASNAQDLWRHGMLWLKVCAPYPHGDRVKRKPGWKKNADKNIWTVLSSSPGSVRASGSGAPHDSHWWRGNDRKRFSATKTGMNVGSLECRASIVGATTWSVLWQTEEPEGLEKVCLVRSPWEHEFNHTWTLWLAVVHL